MPSDETLRKAADLLQKTHDLVEAVGFNIDTYDGGNEAPLRADVSKILDQENIGEIIAPMCYIGSLRYAAGLNPSPGNFEIAADDGPELIEALKAMDRIARRRMNPERRKETQVNAQYAARSWQEESQVAREYPADIWSVGRFVETFGFDIQERAANKFGIRPYQVSSHPEASAYERDYALKLLRKALTEIHTRLADS